MDNKKKIIIGLIAGIIFIIAFLLNLLFPPKPFIKSAHADGLLPDPAPGVDMESLIYEYGYFVPGNQITQSDNMVDNIPLLKGWLPDDYTYGDFLYDTATAFIGSFTACNTDSVDIGIQIIEDLIDAEGFFIDTTSGFIAVPNLSSTLGDFARHYGYDVATSTVGNWVSLPVNVVYNGISNYYDYYYDGDEVFCCNYYVNGHLGYAFATRKSKFNYTRQGKRKSDNSNNGSPSYTINGNGNPYTGSLYSGIYSYNDSSHCFNPELTAYASMSDALADFFGSEIESDFIFNGDVYISDTLSPVNILDIPGNNGRNKSIQRNTDITNNIDNPYGGFNNIVLSPKLEDIPNNHEYELPSYPEIPHDLPEVTFQYPEITQNEQIAEGLEGLNPLWVTLLTMGGTFIVLKVIL